MPKQIQLQAAIVNSNPLDVPQSGKQKSKSIVKNLNVNV